MLVVQNLNHGSFEAVISMARLRCHTMVTKDYTVEEWRQFRENNRHLLCYVIIMCRNEDGQFEKVYDILNELPEIKMVAVNFNQGRDNSMCSRDLQWPS
jgi:hypothetical protein